MLIFVNNIPVHILEKPKSEKYSEVLDFQSQDIRMEKLKGQLFIRNAGFEHIISFVEYLQINKPDELTEVSFLVEDKLVFKRLIKRELKYVKAAGGVVENNSGEILLIKRLGVWDLPKGKADEGEEAGETALREVEEECNVRVFLKSKVVSTWHTYFNKGRLHIKRTKWFSMGLISDQSMKPQAEEGIEELKWVKESELDTTYLSSYLSIQHVLNRWRVVKDAI